MADSRISVSCATCGATMLRYPSHLRGERQYCSRACSHVGASAKVHTACATCGASMLLSPSLIRKANYCSVACANVRKRAYIYRPIPCGRCGLVFQPLTSRTKHCSWQCRFLSIQDQFEGQEGCWEWPLSRLKIPGYGQFNAGSEGMVTAHRTAWELNRGPVPAGLFVLHECDNRPCFRHHHLFLGTQQDNIDDMMTKGRNNRDPAHWLRFEDHPNAKLTVNAVHHIRSCDLSAKALAKIYGVCEGTIGFVRQGKTWVSC